jgi:hypothetical protein
MVAIDVSDPENLRILGTLELGGADNVAASGGCAVITASTRVLVADVSDVTNMSVVDTVTTAASGGTPQAVTISGNYAYVTDGGLEVIDISDPPNSRLIGGAALLPDVSSNVVVANGFCYVADQTAGLQILPAQCDPQSIVTEGDGLSDRLALRVHPNPSFGTTMICLSLPGEASVRATVHDVGGRRVRSLQGGVMRAGVHDLRWDGCDDVGRPIAPGVYLARVSTNEGTASARIVISR